MIYNFEDYINELWTKGLTRNKNNDTRLEDGKNVMTKMGVKIHLHNPNVDYESIIKEIIDSYGEYDSLTYMDIDTINVIRDMHIKLSDLKNNKLYYVKLINNQYIISFEDYNSVSSEYYLLDGMTDEVDEEDYINICQGITDKFKKTEITDKPRDNKCYFLIVSESDVYNFCMNNKNEDSNIDIDINLDIDNVLNIFIEDFKNEFEDVDLELFSYNHYAVNIAVPINYDNLINYDEMKKFAENYFQI